MKILIYDCEIIKAIQLEHEKESKAKIKGIKYCEGFHDHDNMGISVIGTYNNWNKKSIAFVNSSAMPMAGEALKGNIEPLAKFQDMLNECDVLVGFNNQHFDDQLIKANGFTIPENIVNYDILVEMWRAVGLTPPFIFPTHAGFSLDKTCEANGLRRKSGNGGNTAIDWQQGKYQQVIDYCLNDITITTDLFREIMHSNGWITNPKKNIKLRTLTDGE